jgi:glutamate formiminotransferase/formiminotetrahydrofolate cyclodeaminase
LGPAGATVIGSRQPLIAFNVYLTTDDVAIASKIAKVIRQSSGGFRFVKGMGVLVEGRAQVSMNLTNFHKTAIHTVIEAIRREAARYGVMIHHTELIGMIPQEALIASARWYLQLDAFTNEQVLEQKLAALPPSDTGPRKEEFIERVAAGTPTPGGGSAAAHTGALGAALVAMVARLTVGRKKYAEVEAQMSAVLEEAESLRRSLTLAVEQDASAFEAFMLASKLPKDSNTEKAARAEAVEKATFHAAEIPLSVARQALRVCELANLAASLGNLNAISDAGSAAAHARAALNAAGLNVRINLLNYAQHPRALEMLAELAELEAKANSLQLELLRLLAERGGLGA